MSAATCIDTSSLLKLVLDEPGSAEVRALAVERDLVASMLALSESVRAIRRRSAVDVSTKLARIEREVVFISVDELILHDAGRVAPPELRTLDAIHLATALRIGPDLDQFVTSDTRLAAAARMHGLSVVTPGVA